MVARQEVTHDDLFDAGERSVWPLISHPVNSSQLRESGNDCSPPKDFRCSIAGFIAAANSFPDIGLFGV